jgi:nicotinate-nucleotide adenylyltransferase
LKRIGLFGGSFDPPHIAHVALAQEALSNLHLDEVRWIPAGQPWQKSRQLAAPAHREAMVQLAIEHEPRFVLDRCELQRSGPSYTLDTVRELQAQVPDGQAVDWVLLIGQDQYASLHTWRDWKELLSRVTLAVANRPGASVVVNPDVLRTPHRSVPLPMLDISSTQVRAAVLRGENINHLVPKEVASYIARHGLYQAPT